MALQIWLEKKEEDVYLRMKEYTGGKRLHLSAVQALVVQDLVVMHRALEELRK